ncbi:hypothetical protein A8B78_16165 [Jannaschia sp. EhC01]|nr:hypothetical protein A8B78_16165 [Jannaschia sp. EhC01]
MGFLLAGAVWLSLAAPAAAQNPEALTPQRVWDQFFATCTAVLEDPDAYLASLPSPGPYGERVISVSPDQMAVSVFHLVSPGLYDEVQLHIIGDRQLRDCIVIGAFEFDDTQSLVDALAQSVAAQDGASLSGGHTPQDYVEVFDGQGDIYTEEQIHLFAIDGLWPEVGAIALAHVVADELQLSVEFVISP